MGKIEEVCTSIGRYEVRVSIEEDGKYFLLDTQEELLVFSSRSYIEVHNLAQLMNTKNFNYEVVREMNEEVGRLVNLTSSIIGKFPSKLADVHNVSVNIGQLRKMYKSSNQVLQYLFKLNNG